MNKKNKNRTNYIPKVYHVGDEIIEFKNVVISNSNINILKKISLKIFKGERIGIIGSNGSGKTTLVESLVGLKRINSGKIKCFGTHDLPYVKEKFGIQFQSSKYPTALTVYDILKFYVQAFDLKRSAISSYVRKLLVDFNLVNYQDRNIKSLSGGQQQRLNIVLALLNDPEVLILDEVTNGLDRITRTQLIETIKKYIDEKNITLIMVSHKMFELEQLCDKIIVLSFGDLVLETTREILENEYGSLVNFVDEHFALEKRKVEKSGGLPLNLTELGKDKLRRKIKFESKIRAKKLARKKLPIKKWLTKKLSK